MTEWSDKLPYLVVAVTVLAVGALFFATPQPKNLVIFAFDGLQARHLATYGYATTTAPALEQFFKESYVFTNTVSAASWTVPSFMSMFTSRFPSEHKLTNKLVEVTTATSTYLRTAHMQELSPGIVTLAEILESEGYDTAAFTGDAGVKGEYGYSAGFDEYYDKDAFGGLYGSVPRALGWVAQRPIKERPFFMFVHGYDVHGQHTPQFGLDYRYAPEYDGRFTGTPEEQSELRERGLGGKRLNVTDEDIAFWRAVYDEKIIKADAEFALFMRGLYEQGLLDSTIIVVVSDHGTEFFEHGRVDHGHTLYGELLDVVFAIRMPDASHRSIDDLVSTVDIAPTLLSLLDIVPDDVVHKGVDLTPAFSGTRVAHDAFSETDYRMYTHKRSVTTPDGWKFILTRETNRKELYNLTSDPTEQTNIIDMEPRKAYELEQKLLAHLKGVGDTGPWKNGCIPAYVEQCQ